MQINFLKFLKKIFFFFIIISQVADSQAQSDLFKKADILFSQKNYNEAIKIYTQLLNVSPTNNSKIFLKLSAAYESKGDIPECLYYLNLYYLKQPSDAVFSKMANLAEQNNYKGYEKNDLNFIVLLYRQYFPFILLGVMILGVYIFSILIYKRIKKQYTPTRHKFILFIYLIILFVIINIPNNYRAIIIKNNNVYLRDYPSAASQIVGQINEGHRLNVVTSDDIWYQVFWDDKFCYVKDSDVWVIK